MLETRITALVTKLGEKIKYLFTWKAGRDENNTFTEDNEFVKPVKVADGVATTDAVSLGQLDSRIRIANYYNSVGSTSGAPNDFIEFPNIAEISMSEVTKQSNDYEFLINKGGFYEITLSFRSAFNNTTRIMLEVDGDYVIRDNLLPSGGATFQYTFRHRLDDNQTIRLRVEDPSAFTNKAYSLFFNKLK